MKTIRLAKDDSLTRLLKTVPVYIIWVLTAVVLPYIAGGDNANLESLRYPYYIGNLLSIAGAIWLLFCHKNPRLRALYALVLLFFLWFLFKF